MARPTRIEFPFKGKTENIAFTDQAPDETPEAFNVRGIDPVSGRIRGAQRAGYAEITANDVGSASERVRRLETLTLQEQLLTYAQKASGSFDLEGSVTTPAGGSCRNIRLDRQGNVYAIDGRSGVVKYTSEFEEVYRLTVPVESDEHALRELVVDDFGQFYVAVGGGGIGLGGRGRAKEAAIWLYRERLDEGEEDTPACRNATQAKADVVWKLETDGFVKGMVLREGRLYTVQDFPEDNRAELRVYGGIDTTAPFLEQFRPVPYPATSISVGADGAVFMTALAHDRRGLHPKAPNFTATSRDWTPLDLREPEDATETALSKRIWSWYRAKDLEGFADGDRVTFWPDASGNGRHLYNASEDGAQAPIYRSSGIAGAPSLEFAGAVIVEPDGESTHLTTLDNQSDKEAGKDYQSTIVPGYEDGAFALFIVLRGRPQAGYDEVVFGGRTTSGLTMALLLNSALSAGTNVIGGTASSGAVAWHEGTGGSPTAIGSFDNDVDTAVITLVMDGGGGSSNYNSMLRVNGEHVDTWTDSVSMEFLSALTLGTYKVDGSNDVGTITRGFSGEIAELIVLDKQGVGGTEDVIEIPAAGSPVEFVSPAFGAAELEAMEGYLAHEHGIAHLLPGPGRDPANSVPSHPFYLQQGAPRREDYSVAVFTSPESLLNSTDGILAKFDPTKLDAAWVMASWAKWGGTFTGAPAAQFSGERYGGVGYACAVTCDGNVYAIGPKSDFDYTALAGEDFDTDNDWTTDRQNIQVQKVLDNDDAFGVLVVDGAWSDNIPVGAPADEFEEEAVHMEVDDFDNLLIPYYDTDAAAHQSLLVLAALRERVP